MANERVPISLLFQTALDNAPRDHVTPAWIVKHLHRRSFGMVMLLLGLIALLPGVSVFAAILLLVLGFQMIFGYEALVLPRFIAYRSLPTQRIAWLIARSIPLMRNLEKFIRPRLQPPVTATKRTVGLMTVILALTLFTPIPLSNVIPGVSIMLIAFAYLEEDGVMLSVALGVALGSIAITIAEIWATVKGADLLFRL